MFLCKTVLTASLCMFNMIQIPYRGHQALHDVATVNLSNLLWYHFYPFSLTLAIHIFFQFIAHVHRCCSLPVECCSLAPSHASDLISNVTPSENPFLTPKLNQLHILHYSLKHGFFSFMLVIRNHNLKKKN